MEKNRIWLDEENKAFGVKVSKYGLANGYLDYRALAELVGHRILNNNIMSGDYIFDWELIHGYDSDEDGEYRDIYQYYIISDDGYEFLSDYTDEMVFYNENLDMYVWAITHFGTSWDYVLTDVKLM